MEVKTVQERLEAQRIAQSAEVRAQSSRQAAVSAREEAQQQIQTVQVAARQDTAAHEHVLNAEYT